LRWFKKGAEPIVLIPGHNQHHRYTNPVIFDAFSGSLYDPPACLSDAPHVYFFYSYDTTLLILIPLYITSRICFWVNTRTWAAFGSTYSCWFLLIHSEVWHPWDPLLRALGLGTPGDHAVHHAIVVKNFAHYFPILDKLTGSYRSPEEVFARHVEAVELNASGNGKKSN
jgi:sterol desaturase/sphingolipid hydroxylase (fatty acid hydroxylase superfamily)